MRILRRPRRGPGRPAAVIAAPPGAGQGCKPAGGIGMDTTGLEFFTTKELVDELMRRKTFLGVVVHSGDELKSRAWDGEKTFKVHFNANLDTLQASRLLDTVAEYLERDHC